MLTTTTVPEPPRAPFTLAAFVATILWLAGTSIWGVITGQWTPITVAVIGSVAGILLCAIVDGSRMSP